MKEFHPFGIYIPKKVKYLFLGTFPARDHGGWFFGSKRNQFWLILEEVYQRELETIKQKQKLLTDLQMAISDVILACERSKGTNADNNLVNLEFNNKAIEKVVRENKIEQIYFSSKTAERWFRKFGKTIKIDSTTLPSSSPRYAKMSRKEKVERYRELMPKLGEIDDSVTPV